MYRRRYKWGNEKMARKMREHSRRMKSNRHYGVTYGFAQVIHKGRKP